MLSVSVLRAPFLCPADGFESECPPVEVAGALQPVPKLSDGTCPNCFPATATATLPDGSSRPLSQLAVGDRVQVPELQSFPVSCQLFLFHSFPTPQQMSQLAVGKACRCQEFIYLSSVFICILTLLLSGDACIDQSTCRKGAPGLSFIPAGSPINLKPIWHCT